MSDDSYQTIKKQLCVEGQTEPGTAYSYIRFSTRKQELGDSLRRQVELAERFAEKYELTLSASSFRDLGVSGFKQKNLEKGALAAFIGAVKGGTIAPGSILLVEQFDRLGRAEITDAMHLFLDVVKAGIIVVTLTDGKVWNRKTTSDVSNLLTSVILMSRAYEESAAKSTRLRSVWGQKKENALKNRVPGAKIVTSECPRWLRANADKTGFDVIEDRAESVRKVFQKRLAGFGISSIVTMANAEKWAVPGDGAIQRPDEDDASFEARRAQGATWHTSTVGRILRNRAVIGEYQPHTTEHKKDAEGTTRMIRVPTKEPVKNYYPVVIDEDTFLRAQAVADRKGRFPGRRDVSLRNWLQGLLRCGCCGQSFVRKNKAQSGGRGVPGYARYYCTARNRRVTDCPSASAKELETAVLAVVSTVAPAYFQGTARQEELKAKIDILSLEISNLESSRDRFVEAIGMTKTPIPSLLAKLGETETELQAKQLEDRRVRSELAELSGDTESVFENIVKSVQTIDSLEARAELREELSRVIEKVVVFQADGYIRVHLRATDYPIVHPIRIENVNLPGLGVTSGTLPVPAGFKEL